MSKPRELVQPPSAPDIHRRFNLNRWQWLGVMLLLLIPLLALFGLFGESWGTDRDQTAELSVEIRYPTRYRYKMGKSIQLDVTNRTNALLDTVNVEIDTAYLSEFSSVVAIPAFEHPYVVELTALEAGETRPVRVEIQGENYGRHNGEIRVSAGGADTARLHLSTFIFP